MDLIEQLSNLLFISPPFELLRLVNDEQNKEVHLYLGVRKEHIPVNHSINSYYEREWEHLRLFQYRSFIHCEIPIHIEKQTGKLTKPATFFSRDYSRFTLYYEQEVIRLMHIHNCFSTIAKYLGINIQRVESIYYHHYTQFLEDDIITDTPITLPMTKPQRWPRPLKKNITMSQPFLI
jgi:hypothetical protein